MEISSTSDGDFNLIWGCPKIGIELQHRDFVFFEFGIELFFLIFTDAPKLWGIRHSSFIPPRHCGCGSAWRNSGSMEATANCSGVYSVLADFGVVLHISKVMYPEYPTAVDFSSTSHWALHIPIGPTNPASFGCDPQTLNYCWFNFCNFITSDLVLDRLKNTWIAEHKTCAFHQIPKHALYQSTQQST